MDGLKRFMQDQLEVKLYVIIDQYNALELNQGGRDLDLHANEKDKVLTTLAVMHHVRS